MRYEKNRLSGLLLILGMITLLALSGCGKEPAPRVPPGAPKGKPAVKTPATARPYTIMGKTYHPIRNASGFTQEGAASWYGPNFHGKKTSNGETYNMEAMTAAHKLLPMNTYVEVTNLNNGRKETVRINDRGPFVDGRVIDLSKAAARKLGVLGPGTARVKVVALGFKEKSLGGTKPVYRPLKAVDIGPYTVQVGAFTNESNAWRLAASLRVNWDPVVVVRYDRGDKVFHRVRVGKVKTVQQVENLKTKLRKSGFKQAFEVAWEG